MFRMVLLPQPDGPTMETNSPSRILKLSRSTAVNEFPGSPGAGNRRVTASSSRALTDVSADILMNPLRCTVAVVAHRQTAGDPHDRSYLNVPFVIDQLMEA